jgi:hypothetical protein
MKQRVVKENEEGGWVGGCSRSNKWMEGRVKVRQGW